MTTLSPADLTQEIRKHWENASENMVDGMGLKPTVRDPFMQDAVESAFLKHLKPGQTLLDVGCGDGEPVARFAEATQSKVVAVDYIPKFVELTKARLPQATVLQGNILKLDELLKDQEAFDVVTTIRCLINLPTWEEQQQGLDQLVKQVKPGGLFITSEGWADGWEALSEIRVQMGLDPMKLVHHNLLINREQLVAYLQGKGMSLVAYHSLGFYTFLSRVLQPMVQSPEPPQHLHKINLVAAQMVNAGIEPTEFDRYGFPGVCVFQKQA